MKNSLFPQDLTSALIDACFLAGKLIKAAFRTNITIQEKKDHSYVTNIDFLSEKKICSYLKKYFPRFHYFSEESGKESGLCDGYFIIDPLDGTTNFIQGLPFFCVSIAATWEKKIVSAATYDPIQDNMYYSTYEHGAYLNGIKIKCSSSENLSKSFVSTSARPSHSLSTSPTLLQNKPKRIRKLGSAALSLAMVAEGIFDGFWEKNLNPWDFCAGWLLVEQAGGIVTNFEGQSLQYDKKFSILASNPLLHAELLNIIV